MRMRAPGIAVASLLALSGCLTSSGPAWLESGRIDMRDYSTARVLVLPVEITPPYELSESERRVIQDQVTNNLVGAFGLKVVDSLQRVDRTRLYPYQLSELTQLGQLYGVDAVASISIFSLMRESPDPRSENNRMGLRLTFSDANDPTRSWAMSREYRSKRGFDADSTRFENAVRMDLIDVRQQLRSQYGLAAGLKRTLSLGILGDANPEKPRVTVDIPVLGSQFSGDQRITRPSLITEQSLLQFRILAEDVAGLVRTEVRNNKAGFEHTLDYTSPGSKSIELPRRIDESISVALAVGENTVEFLTYNQRALSQSNTIQVRREARQSLYTLGVAISQYEHFGATSVNSGELKRRFEQRAASFGARTDNVIFLEGEEATHRGVERALYNIGSLAQRNDQGLGLFYFTGKVAARKEDIYLLAYDTEPSYVPVTGIGTEDIKEMCAGNCRTILDLCEPDQSTQRRLLTALPNAQISFDSCLAGETRNADDLRDRLNSGQMPKAAVEAILKEKK